MLETKIKAEPLDRPLDLPGLLDLLAHSSARPRYAFMVLNLIAGIADPSGKAGPFVQQEGEAVPLRDWLCDALAPMGHRDPRRLALRSRVQDDLQRQGKLPEDPAKAGELVESEARMRVRASGKTNVSRAVSDLVRAGMLLRHYQGFRVDHHNRGAQRQAVYTLSAMAKQLLLSADRATLRSQPMLPLG